MSPSQAATTHHLKGAKWGMSSLLLTKGIPQHGYCKSPTVRSNVKLPNGVAKVKI